MSTIEQIVKDNGYTLQQLKECKHCNGCGGKGGLHVTGLLDLVISNLCCFDISKEKQLVDDLNIICNMHDDMFNKGGGIIDYLKANYKLALNICKLIHWTSRKGRILLFVLMLTGATLFGWKYFNWKKI